MEEGYIMFEVNFVCLRFRRWRRRNLDAWGSRTVDWFSWLRIQRNGLFGCGFMIMGSVIYMLWIDRLFRFGECCFRRGIREIRNRYGRQTSTVGVVYTNYIGRWINSMVRCKPWGPYMVMWEWENFLQRKCLRCFALWSSLLEWRSARHWRFVCRDIGKIFRILWWCIDWYFELILTWSERLW